jgi:hypothetical protein
MTLDESRSATNTTDLHTPQWIASFHCGIKEILGAVGRQVRVSPHRKYPQWTQKKKLPTVDGFLRERAVHGAQPALSFGFHVTDDAVDGVCSCKITKKAVPQLCSF